MKQQRFRIKMVALLLFGLFALLAVYGLYSIETYGNRWFAYARNPRVREQKQSVIAGDIIDRSGLILATTEDGERVYHEDEAVRRAVVHAVGDDQGLVANGVEGFQTAYLYGFRTTLGERVKALFSGQTRRGDSVQLTLSAELCAKIADSFQSHSLTRGKNGAAVVMNYRTGEVIALTSLSTFDPVADAAYSAESEVYWNRATQSLYPPGSTFKIITTAAALQNIQNAASTVTECTGGLTVNGQTIRDFGNAAHGKLTLKQSFVRSCNNLYARLAVDMGDAALRKAAESFGFNDNFLFRDLVVENSVYPTGTRTTFEVAMSGFGQSSIGMTPLHMCLMASAVANNGIMMEPVLLKAVYTPDGRVRADEKAFAGKAYRTAMPSDVANTLHEYMLAVVKSGTGTRAAVSGLTICGKTGSAETVRSGRDVTHGLFVGYIAEVDCPFAVAVVVENIADGEGGGSTAALIARDIFTWLRDNGDIALN